MQVQSPLLLQIVIQIIAKKGSYFVSFHEKSLIDCYKNGDV